MGSELTTFYIVHPGTCVPWWHAANEHGMTLFCPDEAGVYPPGSCGYGSRESAIDAIPGIWEDALRTSVSSPDLEVITRAELFTRLKSNDPLGSTVKPAARPPARDSGRLVRPARFAHAWV